MSNPDDIAPFLTFLPESDGSTDPSPEDQIAILDERLRDPNTAPPDIIITPPDAPIGRSWLFDFTTGQFAIERRAAVATSGLSTLYAWCEKCLRTDRGSSPLHADDYGMVRPYDMIGEPQGSPVLSDLEARIADALSFHPRIVGIANYSLDFDPLDTYLTVSFDVVLTDETSLSFDNVQLP